MKWQYWALCLILVGCGDSEAIPPADCSAILTWDPPLERTDGEVIDVDDLQKFTIYVSKKPSTDYDDIELSVDLDDVYLITWEVRNITRGKHWFYMTATDKDNNTSAFSNLLNKVCR